MLKQTIESLGEVTAGMSSQDTKAKTESPRGGCLLCGGKVERVLSGLTDTRFGIPGSYEIYRCIGCGVERTSPMPSLSELKTLYETQYNFGGETGTLYTKLRGRFLNSIVYRFWISIDGDISFHSKCGTGRLLDIGCNEGRGLQIYSRNGFHVEGLELNERAAMQARGAGFEVHTCLLGSLDPEAPYDVAVLSNVLEHSLDPQQMLRDVRRILAPGGRIWISCPNNQSWLRGVFGSSWINWHVPFHITHFCSAGITKLLDLAGYTDVEIQQITPALWLTQSLIAYCFAKEGKKTHQLRNPFLTFFFTLFARLVLFPLLWFQNRRGRGDCLLIVARKS